jgi:hypothetical protein
LPYYVPEISRDDEESVRTADKTIRMPYIPLSPSTCPTDIGEATDPCSMETRFGADAQSFEDHYFTCRHCAAAVETAERYVRAMVGAEQRLRGGAPTIN